MQKPLNLDRLAARYGQKIVGSADSSDINNLENLATKTLGVLQEQGVYAALLYLHSRTQKQEQKLARDISGHLHDLLAVPDLAFLKLKLPDKDKWLGSEPGKRDGDPGWPEVSKFFIEQVTDDLNTLLLVKNLLEQTLVYVRYGARAVDAAAAKGSEENGDS